MRFTRIRLENWRNFSQVDVPLQTRAFLVGANATGKSNLLDVFRFLRDLVVPGGGFQKSVTQRGGVSSLRNLAARNQTNILVEVDLEDEEKVGWTYRIVFNQDSVSRPIVREEKIWKQSDVILDRPNQEDNSDPERLSQTYLEQTFANRDFREITDIFRSVHYFHIVPQLVRDPERSTGRQADPFGGDFLEQIAQVNKRSQDARLKRIVKVLTTAVPQLSELKMERDKRGNPHLQGRYKHWRPQGAWQNEQEFSDGTLRLIGLLWALQDGSGPLLLEEPELSLHPAIVSLLPQMMNTVQKERKRAPRQIFISTHSSEMLADPGIGTDEVLLLKNTGEGTRIELGASIPTIQSELEAGFTMAEIVIPRTAPRDVQQLLLWGE